MLYFLTQTVIFLQCSNKGNIVLIISIWTYMRVSIYTYVFHFCVVRTTVEIIEYLIQGLSLLCSKESGLPSLHDEMTWEGEMKKLTGARVRRRSSSYRLKGRRNNRGMRFCSAGPQGGDQEPRAPCWVSEHGCSPQSSLLEVFVWPEGRSHLQGLSLGWTSHHRIDSSQWWSDPTLSAKWRHHNRCR